MLSWQLSFDDTAFAYMDCSSPQQAMTKEGNIWACFSTEATRLSKETWNRVSGFHKGLVTDRKMFQSKNWLEKVQPYLAQNPAYSSVMAQAQWSFTAAHWGGFWVFFLIIFNK